MENKVRVESIFKNEKVYFIRRGSQIWRIKLTKEERRQQQQEEGLGGKTPRRSTQKEKKKCSGDKNLILLENGDGKYVRYNELVRPPRAAWLAIDTYQVFVLNLNDFVPRNE